MVRDRSASIARGLSARQAMVLQGVLPVLLVGIALPIGLVAVFLAFKGAPVSRAVDHGELFLAGGNAAFTGCVVLVAARPDKALNAAIASLVVLVALVMPCYGVWAYVSVQGLLKLDYSSDLAVQGGAAMAIAGATVALAFVRLAYSTGPSRNGS